MRKNTSQRDFTAKTQRAQMIMFFSFAVERTAKENQYLSGRIALVVFRPLSEKQPKKSLCVLCASAVKMGLKMILTPLIALLSVLCLTTYFL